MHQVKGLVNIFQPHGVSDERLQRDLATLGFGYIGRQFTAAFHTTKGTAAPDSAGNQLEGTRADLLTRAGDTDDSRVTPAPMTAFQGGTHQVYSGHAVEGVVHTAAGHVH